MLLKDHTEPVINRRLIDVGLSLRNKIILGFAVFFILLITGLGITFVKVMEVGRIGIGVIEYRQPAALSVLDLLDKIDLATSFLNSYLLTGHEGHKAKFIGINREIKRKFGKIRNKNTDGQVFIPRSKLKEIEALYERFEDYASRLFYLQSHEAENYPGIALAAELLNPKHIEYMGQINSLISELDQEKSIPLKSRLQAESLLLEMRYTWLRMINGIRIFFTTRADKNLQNSKNYQELNGRLYKKLESMGLDIGFYGVDNLNIVRDAYLNNLPKVIEVFRSDAWRSDAYIMKTEVRPIVELLRNILENVSTNQIDASKADGVILTNRLQHIQVITIVILIVGLMIGVLVSIGVIRGTAPIKKLTELITQVALNDPKSIEKSYLARRDEIGDLARAFEAMLLRLSGSYREVQNAKRELEYQKSALDEHAIVSITNIDNKITYVNDKFCEIAQYTRDELLGKSAAVTSSEYHTAEFYEHISSITRGGRVWNGEMISRKKNNDTYWVGTTIVPFMNAEGKPYQFVSIQTDITNRIQAETKLWELNEELEQRVMRRTEELARKASELVRSNKELDQFAYVTSHDLKAPLRAIANLSSWIEEDLEEHLDDETRKQMGLLRGRVNRMEALINGILEYSRIGRVAVDIETVSIEALLSEIIDSLSPPKEFQIVIGANMPTIEAARVRLSQVFSNLLSNCIKYVERTDGKVAISASDIGGYYEFTVADNGPGIAKQYHDKIFQIFQTLQAKDKKESTGVGLTVIKKIIEEQGGMIRVESDENQGASFIFSWPKQPDLSHMSA